ncbi:hypothetical protein AGMMS50268_41790 [Spirochaetia bacterium]|nr:hypothetical protein AGMMS50268_41790 [Spirochaetia bacterium]
MGVLNRLFNKILDAEIPGTKKTIPTVKYDPRTDKERMESVGLKMYIWETAHDERVRPSHALMDGKLCKWADPTVYSRTGGKTWVPRPKGAPHVHPGDEDGCRCVATTFWDELMGNA